MLDDVDSDQEIAVGLLLIIVLWYSCYSVSLHKTIVTQCSPFCSQGVVYAPSSTYTIDRSHSTLTAGHNPATVW